MPSATPAHASSSDELLGEVRRAVDARLDVVLAELERDAESAGPEPRAVAAAVADLVRRGGKRLRPALVVAAHRACGGARHAAAIDAGAAWELLQAYFLVQDDWMDHDATRRGGPAVHVALTERHRDAHLGASLAILGSDLASALAHRVLASMDAPADVVRAAVLELSVVHRDVVLGQALDLVLSANDLAAVERMHALKTASYTTRGPLAMGAILAGAPRDTFDAFAQAIGVAFQLRDDLLGVFGSEAETGKPAHSDLRARKRTALIAEALRRLSGDDRDALGRFMAGEGDVATALALVEKSGARRAIEARIDELSAEADRALSATNVHDRSLLEALATRLARRSA